MSPRIIRLLSTLESFRAPSRSSDAQLRRVDKKALETQSQLLVTSESTAPLVIRREIRDQVKES